MENRSQTGAWEIGWCRSSRPSGGINVSAMPGLFSLSRVVLTCIFSVTCCPDKEIHVNGQRERRNQSSNHWHLPSILKPGKTDRPLQWLRCLAWSLYTRALDIWCLLPSFALSLVTGDFILDHANPAVDFFWRCPAISSSTIREHSLYSTRSKVLCPTPRSSDWEQDLLQWWLPQRKPWFPKL